LYKSLPTVASVGAIITGCLVLIGWRFDLPALQQVLPGLPKMTANTAVAFVLAGLSLWLYTSAAKPTPSYDRQRRLAQVLAAFVTLIGLLTLSQYLFGWDGGLDQLLVEDPAGAEETSIPGRPSPHTALAFAFTGLSLLLIHRDSSRHHWLAQYFTFTAAFIALLALVGYAFSISFLFSISAYTGMALHTALTFILLCAGLLFLHPDRGFMALMTTGNLGSLMARRLVLVAIGVPLLVGWVSILGQQAGLYPTEFEPVLLAVLSAYGFSGAIWWYAHSLNRMDTGRQQAEETLRQNEERTRLIVENALDAVITIDTESRISDWNSQAEAIFGWSHQEVVGHSLDIILPPQYRAAHHHGMQHFLATGEGPVLNTRFEISALRRDGAEFPVELTISPIRMGEHFIFSAFIRDITERQQAEEQLRLVVEASPNAIILVNTEGKISLVNKRTETLFGYSQEELLGRPIEMLVPPHFRAHHNDYRNAFFAAPTARPMGAGRDLFGLCKDGSQVPVEIGLSPITTPEGSFVLVSIIDITERKRAEAEIAESLRREQAARVEAEAAQQRLAFLAEASSTLASSLDYHLTLAAVSKLAVPRLADWCAVDVVEPDGSLRRVAVVHTDPAKVALAYELQRRYPPDPETPRGVYHVLRTGQAEFYPEISDSLLEATGLDEEQLHIIRELGLKSAITVPMLARDRAFGAITFVLAESGRHYDEADLALAEELAGRAVLAIDNARLHQETKKANEELERRVLKRTAQLEAANKELEAFSYSVSHDLRAPLRSIDGFSQALLEDYGDRLGSEAQHYLRRVRAGSQRMAELIDDLLTLSRMTLSEMRLENVSLSSLAQTIATGLRETEPEREVKFIIVPEATVEADRQLMRVVLENLLGNAWKFTARQAAACIEFGTWPQAGGQPAYFVRDDGAGFDMAYADKLFGAFQRLHTPAEFSGTGIGLATVQRIIHRHGGRVWAEGAVEEGATFYFTLGSFGAPGAGSRQ
jgi:PAS domain S-box-containing protein